MDLALAQIRTDGGTQPREKIDSGLVDEYAEVLNDMPPVVVFYDGENYWLADGYHRRAAAVKLGWPDMKVEVMQGTVREAKLYSFGANAKHGARRTRADKERAVRTMLADEEWCKWSDAEIARRCGVSRPMVAGLRQSRPAERVYINAETKKPAVMNVAKIGQMTHAVPKPGGGKSSKVSFGSSSRHEIRIRLRGDDYEALERIARGNMQHVEEAALDILVEGIVARGENG